MTGIIDPILLEALSLTLAILAFLLGVRKGEKSAVKADAEEKILLHDKVAHNERNVQRAHERLDQHEQLFITDKTCATLRASLHGDVGREWMEAYCSLGERIASMESTLKMVASNQLEVYRAQTTMADTQRATSAVLAELSDKLHRRATDRPDSERRGS